MGDHGIGMLVTEWGNLDLLLDAMDKVGGQAGEINDYVSQHVCDPSGFDYSLCALKPLGDKMGDISDAFDAMRRIFEDHWSDLTYALARTAREFDRVDGEVDHAFSRFFDGTPVGDLRPDKADW